MPSDSSPGFEAAYDRALAALRVGRAESAERQLREMQSRQPGEIKTLHLLGVALLDQEKAPAAVEVLERVAAAAPRFWQAHADLARAYRAAGLLQGARSLLRRVVIQAPQLVGAWLAYGDVLVDLEMYPDAKAAYERAALVDPHRQRIEEATAALTREDRKTAETIFRDILRADPSHVASLCGLAAVSLTVSRGRDALRLLRHAQKQSAHLPLTQRGTCQALVDLGRLPEAESTMRRLLRIEDENPRNWVMLATVYTRMMRQVDALAAYERAQSLNPGEIRLRLSIGHLHKTLGNRVASEAAYKRCLELDPTFTEAYWSLADLKNYVFDDAETASMRSLQLDEGGDDNAQAMLEFALGRALEQQRQYAAAFHHYDRGNARRRRTASFDIARFEGKSRRIRELMDRAFFEARSSAGFRDGAPIFIVGLPRSGSTLVEQILASHPSVEGTFELPNVLTIVREFDHADAAHDAYPEGVREAPPQYLTGLGARYIAETAAIRTGRRHFIDKMPNNFSHVGLIHLMLPDAIVVDVRRHPMDSCFSTFKQYFAEGQSFSYSLEDLGRYYRCYLELMDHWDEVLPGKVLHLQYEELVLDAEANIRKLLAHCALPFDAACLAFHETKRPVRTASAEQVRQPLYASGVGYWRHFEAQLAPLRRALGDCLERFEF